MNKMYIALFMAMMMFSVFADDGAGTSSSLKDCGDANLEGFESLKCIFCCLKMEMTNLLGPIAFLLVIMAAVIYAGGQLGDAQLRSKAQGWAVMAIVGALIAFILSTVGQMLMTAMFKDTCGDYCSGTTTILE